MAEEQKSEKKVKPTPKQTAMGILMMVVLCGGPCGVCMHMGSQPRAPGAIDAQLMCENAVEKMLKFPETAEFPFTASQSIESATDTHLVFGVAGDVIAKNAFGVPSRKRYNCRLTWKKPEEGEEPNGEIGWEFAGGPELLDK